MLVHVWYVSKGPTISNCNDDILLFIVGTMSCTEHLNNDFGNHGHRISFNKIKQMNLTPFFRDFVVKAPLSMGLPLTAVLHVGIFTENSGSQRSNYKRKYEPNSENFFGR